MSDGRDSLLLSKGVHAVPTLKRPAIFVAVAGLGCGGRAQQVFFNGITISFPDRAFRSCAHVVQCGTKAGPFTSRPLLRLALMLNI